MDVVAASAAGPSRATAGSRYTYGTPELEAASGDHQRLVYGQHLELLVVGALLDGPPLAGFTVSFEPTALGGPIYKDLLVNIPKFETGPTGIARAPGFWALSTPGTTASVPLPPGQSGLSSTSSSRCPRSTPSNRGTRRLQARYIDLP